MTLDRTNDSIVSFSSQTMLFIHCGLSYTDEVLTIASEIAFRYNGDTLPKIIKDTLALDDEKLERISLAGAWLDFVERKPYNTKCFNHWRYINTPINESGEMEENPARHYNEDNLVDVLNEMTSNAQKITDPWAFHLSTKVWMATLAEINDPTHVVDFYDDDQFNQGSNYGQDFMIKVNGKEMSIHDYWGTACGRFNYHYPFSSDAWKEIDTAVTSIIEQFPSSKLYSDTTETNYNFTKNIALTQVYWYNKQMIKPGDELPDGYQSNCEYYTNKLIAKSGFTIHKKMKYLTVPQSQKVSTSPVNSSEGAAWAVFLLLLPFTIFLLWNYVSTKLKQD